MTVNNQRVTLSQEARPCTFDLSGSSVPMSSAGGLGSLQVTTLNGCSWNASASASWIRVNTSSGNGSGTVQYEITPNGSGPREGIITVADRQHTVRQDGFTSEPGSGPPLPSNCAPSVNPRTIDIPLAGGSASIALTINASCDWTAAAGASDTWLTVTPATGRGNGPITVRADRNDGATRTATVTIAQQAVTVTQSGSCAVTITPSNASYEQPGGTGVIRVETAQGCTWTASSNQPQWATVTQSTGGGTSSEARYSVSTNTSTSTRTAVITIGTRQHTVTQRGCSFTLSPSTATVPAAGGRGTLRVNTADSCPWTVSGAITGMSVDPSSSTGSRDVSYTVPPNSATATRTITLRIGGQSHVITQEAAAPPPPTSCTFQLDSGSRNFPVTGGAATVRVTANPPGCAGTWSVSGAADWTPVTGGSGSGSGEFSYTVSPNPGTGPRSVTLSVGGQSHTITQDGPAPTPTCTFQLDSGSRSFPADGGGLATIVRVTGTPPGCTGTWQVAGVPDWVQVSGGSGSASGEFSYTVLPNTGTAQRTATLTVGGQTHQITQAGMQAPTPTCTFQLNPTSRNFTAAGGEGRFTVFTQPNCQWSASKDVGWVNISSGSGSGQQEVVYKVDVNSATSTRSTAIVVNGQAHTVTQEGMVPPPPALCTYSIDPTERSANAEGALGIVQVTTGAGCPWTARANDSWIRLNKTSDTGSAGVGYLVEPNFFNTDRVGTAAIAGQTFTVRQQRRTSGPGDAQDHSASIGANFSPGEIVVRPLMSGAIIVRRPEHWVGREART